MVVFQESSDYAHMLMSTLASTLAITLKFT